jgi:hypothetical protein
MLTGLFGVVLLLGFPIEPAAGTDDLDDPNWEAEAVPSRECPELFGDQDDRDENRLTREESLESVKVCKYAINLVHTADWRRPKKVQLEGLELIDICIEEGRTPLAVLRLEEPLEEIECEPGLYIVKVDDSIGADVQVLYILENVLLLEYDGQLGYLVVEGEKMPMWRLIWRSTWKMPRLPDSSRQSKSRTPRRSHPRRKRHRRR